MFRIVASKMFENENSSIRLVHPSSSEPMYHNVLNSIKDNRNCSSIILGELFLPLATRTVSNKFQNYSKPAKKSWLERWFINSYFSFGFWSLKSGSQGSENWFDPDHRLNFDRKISDSNKSVNVFSNRLWLTWKHKRFFPLLSSLHGIST